MAKLTTLEEFWEYVRHDESRKSVEDILPLCTDELQNLLLARQAYFKKRMEDNPPIYEVVWPRKQKRRKSTASRK